MYVASEVNYRTYGFRHRAAGREAQVSVSNGGITAEESQGPTRQVDVSFGSSRPSATSQQNGSVQSGRHLRPLPPPSRSAQYPCSGTVTRCQQTGSVSPLSFSFTYQSNHTLSTAFRCVQILIEEKLRQYRAAVSQIVQLEDATEKVITNLLFSTFSITKH